MLSDELMIVFDISICIISYIIHAFFDITDPPVVRYVYDINLIAVHNI